MAYTGNHAMGAASIIQRGGEQSARNIQAMGNILGQQKQQRMDNKEARKRYTSLLKELGQDPDALEGMSIGELEGTFQGVKEKFGQQYMQEKIQNAQMANQQMQAALQAEEATRNVYAQAEQIRASGAEVPPQYQGLFENPNFVADLDMYQAAGTVAPEWARERYAPEWKPSVSTLPDGTKAMTTSPRSAQVLKAEQPPERKKPAAEVLYDAVQAAEDEGNPEKAAALEKALNKALQGNVDFTELARMVRYGELTAEQMIQIVHSVGGAPGQESPAPAPKPAARKPVDSGSFFDGLR